MRRFIERELAPHEARWAERGYIDREVWNRAGEVGLLCASIPEEYGGGGNNFAHEAVITMEMARAIVSSLGNGVHSGIVAHYLLNYGTEEQKRKWLPKMATGELVAAIAMSGARAGSDLKSVRTRAVREVTGWRMLSHQRCEDLHHQRLSRRHGVRGRQDRPGGRRARRVADHGRDA